jgi:LmbE family N-acetylglucosaminyl deacetylase
MGPISTQAVISFTGILERVAASTNTTLPLPRVLVILAHPDDEVLALGARMERYRASRFLCVTDGAPRDGADGRAHGFHTLEGYRAARRAELQSAFEHALLPRKCARFLQLPGPHGANETIADQAGALHLSALTRQLVYEIEAFQPEAILTHPYEGGHPDHDSCAFAVHAAVRLAQNAPIVVEAPFYHAGPHGMETGCFLAALQLNLRGMPTPSTCHLSPKEQQNKRERLACFASQQEILKQFGTERELYRIAPAYDFTQPPHGGQLLYEGFGWDMNGARFRSLATDAFHALGLAADPA